MSGSIAAEVRRLCEALAGGLVVSCQASPGEPLHGADTMAAMARAVVSGGACAVRANGADDVRAIRAAVTVPILGLEKDDTGAHPVRITPTLEHARRIADAGADAIALDATDDARPEGGLVGFIAAVHGATGLPVVADVSTLDEALRAEAAGADLVATTLSGHTSRSRGREDPDLELVAACVAALRVPVVAEGGYRHGHDVRRALDAGALCVVVGTAITRPQAITSTLIAEAGIHRGTS
ncbi:MAG: putative N-acetylmannosamine-6-phosphate 2-epimerase [Actinomycetota bacterium]|jgi:N-acylglucosamine-6-phosphate 2-epimerase